MRRTVIGKFGGFSSKQPCCSWLSLGKPNILKMKAMGPSVGYEIEEGGCEDCNGGWASSLTCGCYCFWTDLMDGVFKSGSRCGCSLGYVWFILYAAYF